MYLQNKEHNIITFNLFKHEIIMIILYAFFKLANKQAKIN